MGREGNDKSRLNGGKGKWSDLLNLRFLSLLACDVQLFAMELFAAVSLHAAALVECLTAVVERIRTRT